MDESFPLITVHSANSAGGTLWWKWLLPPVQQWNSDLGELSRWEVDPTGKDGAQQRQKQ
jgi:hypothetical protein